MPKSVAYRLVSPAMRLEAPVKLLCREGRLDALLADLAIHRLDLVIADRPMPARLSVRAFNHPLGEHCAFGIRQPGTAHGPPGAFSRLPRPGPFLMPGEDVTIRGALVDWFAAQRLRPGSLENSTIAPCSRPSVRRAQDSSSHRAPPAPMCCAQYGVDELGRIDTVVERLYAITTEKLTRPAILAIQRGSGRELFAEASASPAPQRQAPPAPA